MAKRKPKNRGGRPQTKLNAHDIKTAVKLAGNGATNRQLAAGLGISEDTLARIFKRSAGFAAQIEDARQLGTLEAAEAVWEILKDKKHRDRLKAATLVLKARAGWKEGNEDLGTPGNPLTVAMPSVGEIIKAVRKSRA